MLKPCFLYFFIFPIFLLLNSGCNRHVASKTPLVIYPAPPDTARIQYLTSYASSLDVSGKRSALQQTVMGEDLGMPIGKPYGIATAAGKIFICDATIHGLNVINLAKKSFTQFVPTGKGQLKLPLNCITDKDGKLYITDAGRNEVVIFDANLNYVSAIGKTDTGDHFRPLDICVSDTKIWVTNPTSNKVNVYQKDSHQLLSSFPDSSVRDQVNLYNPVNIYYRNGKIYVTDFGDFKVKIFDEQGKYIRSVGEYGKSIGQFVRPKGISVDKQDNLFVVDAGFENVQIFNNIGKLLMFFGGPYKGPGDMWLPAKVYIDYDNLQYYKKWVSSEYKLDYLIFVTNQYGPDKVSVYGAIKPASGR
ncbi:MAG: 6-bladed beta-propeller [Chitinophagaceae bacterium]